MPRLLTDQEVAKIVRLRPSTLRKMRLLPNGIPFRKLGSAVRYEEAAVREWIAAQPLHRTTRERVA